MSTNSWSRVWVAACLVGAAALSAAGCAVGVDADEAGDRAGSAESVESVESESQSLVAGPRCTVSGDPPVTQGCGAGEVCRVLACTNSIPPSCFGTCIPAGCIYGVARDCCGNLACRPGPKLPPPCPIFCAPVE